MRTRTVRSKPRFVALQAAAGRHLGEPRADLDRADGRLRRVAAGEAQRLAGDVVAGARHQRRGAEHEAVLAALAAEAAGGTVAAVVVEPAGLVIELSEQRAQGFRGVAHRVDAVGDRAPEHAHPGRVTDVVGEVGDHIVSQRIAAPHAFEPPVAEVAVARDRGLDVPHGGRDSSGSLHGHRPYMRT